MYKVFEVCDYLHDAICVLDFETLNFDIINKYCINVFGEYDPQNIAYKEILAICKKSKKSKEALDFLNDESSKTVYELEHNMLSGMYKCSVAFARVEGQKFITVVIHDVDTIVHGYNATILEKTVYQEILSGMSNVDLEESVYDQIYKTILVLLKTFDAKRVSIIKTDEVNDLFPMSVRKEGIADFYYNPIMKDVIYKNPKYAHQMQKYHFVEITIDDLMEEYPLQAEALKKENNQNFVLMNLEYSHGLYHLVIEDYKVKVANKKVYTIIYNYIKFALKSFLYNRNLYQLSNIDSLTNLYNRNKFNNDLEILKTKKLINTAVVFVDLDKLKFVNDTFGHNAGDKLLIDTAAILKKQINYGNVYRIGGDEFVIIIENYDMNVFENDIKMVKKLLKVNNIYCSIGWVIKETDGNIDAMMALAEKEMYIDKNSKH